MSEAWIIDAVRTPRGIGKVGKGALAEIHPQQLGATVLRALAELLLVPLLVPEPTGLEGDDIRVL